MTQKRNNQGRIKKVTIISNENLYKLNPFIKKCDSTHRETMLEFIYETGIELPVENIYRTSSQELAYELTQEGFAVLLYSSHSTPANLTIYLPEQLSDEQKQYIKLATSLLTDCNLTVFSLNIKEEVFEYQVEASQNVENLTTYINKVKCSLSTHQENNGLTRKLQATEPKNS